ncbi:hypothetical protein [Variovorax sp. Root411]|uniref:hypothetical protein n=1 Tax=Variovorax sp. Root411 TaxID=1736530 RepID=UPI0006FAD4F9|nr:hypothetical protein [Variovorax sp. Root411]KQW57806.1 hypothetical protein ASC92_09265 [Variovorax sp. Root411]
MNPAAEQPRTCVYTILVGDYEPLNEQPVAARSSLPFLCLTDDPALTSDTWQVVQVPTVFGMDPVRSQRMLKICPHEVEALRGFDRSLYVDNSVILRETPEEVIARHPHGSGMGLPLHSYRDSVLDEFIEVARLGLDDSGRIFEQLNHYLGEDDPALAEPPHWTAILLRDHRHPKVRDAMSRWLAHVLRYSRRDQLSFNTAVRAAGFAPDAWPLDNRQSWFHTWPHTAQRRHLGGMRHPVNSAMPWQARLRELQGQLETARTETDRLRADLQGAGAHAADLAHRLQSAEAAAVARDTQERQQAEVHAAVAARWQEESSALKAELAGARHRAEQLQREAETAHGGTAAVLAAVRASTSWRVTAPLRRLKRWLR